MPSLAVGGQHYEHALEVWREPHVEPVSRRSCRYDDNSGGSGGALAFAQRRIVACPCQRWLCGGRGCRQSEGSLSGRSVSAWSPERACLSWGHLARRMQTARPSHVDRRAGRRPEPGARVVSGERDRPRARWSVGVVDGRAAVSVRRSRRRCEVVRCPITVTRVAVLGSDVCGRDSLASFAAHRLRGEPEPCGHQPDLGPRARRRASSPAARRERRREAPRTFVERLA